MRPNRILLSGVLATCLAASGPVTADVVSDTWSEASLTTAYTLNEQLNPFDIEVEVQDGKAILGGTVESEVSKELAGEIASATNGVTSVENRLKVVSDAKAGKKSANGFARKVEDATITAKVKSQLLWNTATSGLDIGVDTDDGVVRLSGQVESREEAALVRQIAMNTRGVHTVKHAMEINGQSSGSSVTQAARQTAESAGRAVADTWITAKVKSALLYNRKVDGTALNVDTDNGVVMLKGVLSNAEERAKAVDIAKGIIGVQRVEDSIEVATSS